MPVYLSTSTSQPKPYRYHPLKHCLLCGSPLKILDNYNLIAL